MWLPLALFAAFTASLGSLITKNQVKSIHPIVVLFLNMSFVLIFMLIVLLFVGFPQLTPKFYFFMFCSSILDVIAFSAGYWAYRHTQISILAPLNAFTPVFAMAFGALFLNEIPTIMKLVGILTIVCGMYLLNVAEIKGGILKPFQKLFSDKGVRLYFVQVFLWGITPIFQKQAIFETHPTTPLFAAFFGFFLVAVYLSFYAVRKIPQEKIAIKKNIRFFIAYGLLIALAQLAAYTVFATTYVGYATAIFSLSSLITVGLGGMLFKERHIRERLLGASVMIIGTILLAL